MCLLYSLVSIMTLHCDSGVDDIGGGGGVVLIVVVGIGRGGRGGAAATPLSYRDHKS